MAVDHRLSIEAYVLRVRTPPIDKLLQSMHRDQGVLHRLCQAYRRPITGRQPSHAEYQESEGGLEISDAAMGMDVLPAQQGRKQTAPICGVQHVLAERPHGWRTAHQEPLSAQTQALTACG